MTDSSSKRSSPERAGLEDPDTAATRKELKQTAISDKQNSLPAPVDTPSAASAATKDGDDEQAAATTPELSAAEPGIDRLKEQVSSPKKKRAHDEVDETQGSNQTANGDVSPLAGSDNRSDRSEPEKKRPRDVSSEVKGQTTEATTSASKDTDETEKSSEGDKKKTTQTTASAFSSSGLSAFATTSSPFSATSSKPLSSFSSGTASASPFKTMGSSSSSVFGGSSLSSGSSPFGQASAASKPFGSSSIGSGFGSSFGGAKLTSFGKAGEAFKSTKPAKAFGAPESDAESDNEDEPDEDADEPKETSEEKKAEEDEKKKVKLHKVVVDDGETGEATILSVRAKIYYLDKLSKAWKERGAGNLKINVPLQCVDIDEDTGAALPGSFDASSLEDGDAKIVRLVMRQDSTHRVILNTAIFPAMKFSEKAGLKSVAISFTALEGNAEPVSIQLKLNAVNAKSFLNEVAKVQRELQSA
ncbi:uncharacterized protein B0I36DRAFT_360822 [Microdochium trichocladiopsis]|uniref:RanBD1 domain-containing protein n=1 Tax=Microdochium trichocladiopsis TaxID=1682393 RepID=A0A9P8YCM5_9PEZI|nr:uncharacterized protein B0I36DRAFT_360822 [Microdochium trichocladiopsis]KAH7035465.1 hypothetical protein B0I36DRAFT_360822 [Microdochium trichocladiopsis]